MRERILALLAGAGGGCLSGESISRTLGVSRAAVWKVIDALREEGWEIEASPRRGYCLRRGPDRLCRETVLPHLAPGWEERLVTLESVDSTNDYAKGLAMRPEGFFAGGTAVVAEEQTNGRGRNGRSFQSPRGRGVYLSMLWRPEVPPVRALRLTACAAVAVCDGIEAVCGLRPGIKWTNDIVLNGKKLAGILTEMSVEGETGALSYVVCGAGINVNHAPEDFSGEVRDMAASLAMALGRPVDRPRLCAGLLTALDDMYRRWLAGREDAKIYEQYRWDCVTLGKPVRLLRGDRSDEAFAEDLDEDFSLIVRRPDGRRETVTAGEVSVRGLYGYNT